LQSSSTARSQFLPNIEKKCEDHFFSPWTVGRRIVPILMDFGIKDYRYEKLRRVDSLVFHEVQQRIIRTMNFNFLTETPCLHRGTFRSDCLEFTIINLQ
jgi:hypothetical protein